MSGKNHDYTAKFNSFANTNVWIAMTKSDGLVALHKTQTTAQSASKSVTVLSTTVNETNEGVVTTLYTQFGSIDTAFLFLSDSSLKSEVKLDNATKIIRDLKKELQFKDDQLHKKELKILGQDKLLNLKENRIKAKENRLRSNKETISSQNEKVGQLEIELSLKDKKIEKIGNELHKATHKLTDGDVELWPFMKKLRQARAPQKNIDEVVLDIFQKLASFRLDTKHTDVSLGIALKQMVGQILCTVEADGQDSYTPIPVDIMEKELVKYTYNVAWNNIIDAFVIKVRFQKPEDFKTLGQYRQEYLNAQQYEQFSTLPTPNKGSMATQTWYDKGMSILNSRFQWIETNTKHLYVGLVPAYKDSNDPSKGYKWQGHWAIWTGTAYKVFVWVQDRQIWYCETDEISICIEEDAVRFLKGNLHDPQMPPVGPKVWEGSETGPFWDRVASECEQQWEWEQERQTKEYEAWITQEQKKAQQEIQMRGFFNSLQNKRTAQDDADNQKKNQDFFTDLLNDFDDEIF
jgi:hypothetical protein